MPFLKPRERSDMAMKGKELFGISGQISFSFPPLWTGVEMIDLWLPKYSIPGGILKVNFYILG